MVSNNMFAAKLALKRYMYLNKHPFRLFSHGNTTITHND